MSTLNTIIFLPNRRLKQKGGRLFSKPVFIIVLFYFLLIGLLPQSRAADLSRDSASPTELTIPHPIEGTDPIYNYIVDILTMTLELTASKYGPVTLLAVEEAALQSSQLRELEHRQLDITWSVTSRQRETQHRAIFIPLTNGLFGKRILMLRKNDHRFSEPLNEQAIKRLRLVQGHDWPDAQIFRSNGYKVVEASYGGAFAMLSEGFADAFPRGVLEIYQELAEREDELFKIERHLLFNYPSALFFFVSKERNMLAVRLEQGLKKLYATGKLQKHLQAQTFYRSAVSTMDNRTFYQLSNPLLSDKAAQALEVYRFKTE